VGTVVGTAWKNCRYCGLFLCSDCSNRRFVIPWMVMQKGDFQPHTVCQPCESHLQSHIHMPLLDLSKISSTAKNSIGRERLETIFECRRRILIYLRRARMGRSQCFNFDLQVKV